MLDPVEGFMQKVVFINELCRCACVCASVIQTAHTTMSVTRMKACVISKCSESQVIIPATNINNIVNCKGKQSREITVYIKANFVLTPPPFFALDTAMLYCQVHCVTKLTANSIQRLVQPTPAQDATLEIRPGVVCEVRTECNAGLWKIWKAVLVNFRKNWKKETVKGSTL